MLPIFLVLFLTYQFFWYIIKKSSYRGEGFMYYDMNEEEKVVFKQKLYEQLNYGRLRQMEKSLKLLHFFFWGLVTLTVVLGLVTAFSIPHILSGITVSFFIIFLIWTLMFIKLYKNSVKTLKKNLNDFIMEISNGKMTYDEYKICKNRLM